jgi:hypothetical protein
MRKVAISLANDTHSGNLVVSLSCEKDYKFISKVKSMIDDAFSMKWKFLYNRHSSHGKIKRLWVVYLIASQLISIRYLNADELELRFIPHNTFRISQFF